MHIFRAFHLYLCTTPPEMPMGDAERYKVECSRGCNTYTMCVNVNPEGQTVICIEYRKEHVTYARYLKVLRDTCQELLEQLPHVAGLDLSFLSDAFRSVWECIHGMLFGLERVFTSDSSAGRCVERLQTQWLVVEARSLDQYRADDDYPAFLRRTAVHARQMLSTCMEEMRPGAPLHCCRDGLVERQWV